MTRRSGRAFCTCQDCAHRQTLVFCKPSENVARNAMPSALSRHALRQRRHFEAEPASSLMVRSLAADADVQPQQDPGALSEALSACVLATLPMLGFCLFPPLREPITEEGQNRRHRFAQAGHKGPSQGCNITPRQAGHLCQVMTGSSMHQHMRLKEPLSQHLRQDHDVRCKAAHNEEHAIRVRVVGLLDKAARHDGGSPRIYHK